MNLAEHILERAALVPHRIAISDGHDERTYEQLTKRVQQIASGLRQGGHSNQTIALLSGNRMEFAEFVLGAIYAGSIPVLLDPKWSPAAIEQVIRQCAPGLLVSEAGFAADLTGRYSRIPQLYFSREQVSGSYEAWVAGFDPVAEAADNPELLFIGYTSGTTGIPKGYMRTHLSWLSSLEATDKAFSLNRMQHVLAPGPFVHSLSLFALLQSLYSRATFHLLPEFDAERVLTLCSRVPDMILFVVPAMTEALLRQTESSNAIISIQSLISSGGKWPVSSIFKCREKFKGVRLYEYYGSSEASYISYLELTGAEPQDSLGQPFSGVELMICDEQFREVPPGTAGELYIRSDMIFSGYHLLPEETARVFRDGWLRTGDYVYQDRQMHLRLAGRAGSMIKSGGLKVFPEEVEAVLLRHPNIREAMVFGIADERWGEQVTLMIQWQGQERLTLDEIRTYCRPYLASYKLPKQLISVEEFSYTGSGKIARQLMKNRAAEELT
ncbi:AMP-binding protein [Paenibacillus sp. FSL H7-0350]|uniref:class I adenylate-forming enzyme family protein n=1 Tax=Paenibacillus sp. FSL H7-0350 TaxID=2975345 RepID=UPI0031596986